MEENYSRIFKEPEEILNTINGGIEKLKKLGYKKFVVFGFPNLTEVPMIKELSGSSKFALNILSTYINNLLENRLKELQKNSEFIIKVINNKSVQKIFSRKNMKFLKALGIDSMDSACYDDKNKSIISPNCKDPRSYFYYDRVHPTSLVHAIEGAIIAEYI
ncbi:hypothetical protein AYI70_g3432 [Smittium culicis]|uniref:GDSL esterase/lipase n=1 Tax=Smittium culicis TaxID=133412 RepID=A0A1R1Y3I0_9FUNG|nr:hypothetical protein AYI70_g3432 [Smittium culicis]